MDVLLCHMCDTCMLETELGAKVTENKSERVEAAKDVAVSTIGAVGNAMRMCFVHVDVLDEPYTMEFKVTELIKSNIIRIDFRLGFRVEPRINLMFRKVVEDLVRNFEVDITSRYESLGRKNLIGDFRFVVMEKFLSYDNELPFYEKIIMDIYFFFKRISLSEERAFGLDTSSVTIEKVPMVVSTVKEINLKRIK